MDLKFIDFMKYNGEKEIIPVRLKDGNCHFYIKEDNVLLDLPYKSIKKKVFYRVAFEKIEGREIKTWYIYNKGRHYINRQYFSLEDFEVLPAKIFNDVAFIKTYINCLKLSQIVKDAIPYYAEHQYISMLETLYQFRFNIKDYDKYDRIAQKLEDVYPYLDEQVKTELKQFFIAQKPNINKNFYTKEQEM